MENYRGITLLNTAYKIYAGVLTETLKSDMEEKGVIQVHNLVSEEEGVRCQRTTACN